MPKDTKPPAPAGGLEGAPACDETFAPVGYRAVVIDLTKGAPCSQCILGHTKLCDSAPCTPMDRPDNADVYFVKAEKT